MELAKQGRPPQPPSPPPSPSHRSAQVPYHPVPLPDDWGARAPRSCYLISPMSQQPARAGVSRPSSGDLTGARPLNRVSLMPPQQMLSVQTGFPGVLLRPPQQMLSVQTGFPGVSASQPSTGKKTAMSPKVQMLKSPPSLLSADKRYVQKEPLPKSPPLDPVRSTFRESLAAALSTDSDQQTGQESSSSENVSPVGSARQNRQAGGGRMQGITAAFHGAGKDDDNVTKVAASRSQHSGMLCSNLGSNMAIKGKHDTQQRTEHVSFIKKVFGSSTIALDGISQGHGLAIVVGASESMPQPDPKRAKMSDVHGEVNASQIGPQSKRKITTYEVIEKKKVIHKDQRLASKIEKELFRLFGGANKKYKEKGRSLLFNLKDKNNPVLTERVLSGEISPKCLCAMTIEELASKELSKWRVAKAEELAKRAVLPAIEVDVTSLVRKTHKGIFQVEVEKTDAFPVEFGLGVDSRSNVTSEPIAVQTKSGNKTSAHREINVTENRPWFVPLEVFMQFVDSEPHSIAMDKAVGTWNNNTSSDLEYPANEENRPWIIPLKEFLWVLYSEPHSKDQPIGALQDDPNINKADKVNSANFPIAMAKAAVSEFQFHSDVPSPRVYCESKLEPINKPVSVLDPVEEPKRDLLVKSSPEKVDAEKSHAINGSTPESTMQCKITPDAALMHNSIWEGTIQLSLSSLTTIVAIFKSGERPSTNKWRRLLEIKGTVRLSVLKEFLEQLPKSRSRTIMVTELRWKEGSLESGRHHLLKAIDSYTADERVGLVKPAQEVDLYLCPSRGKACQILADHLPKEHLGSLIVPRASIIGVVVWRRPHASSRVPSRQDGSKRQATTWSSRMISKPPSRSSNGCRQEGVTADVPPGIGSGVVGDDDDLCQYNFASISNSAADATASQSSHQHLSHTSDSIEDQVRELVHKYGDCDGDGDDDDMPERDPYSQGNLQQARIQQSHYPCQEYHHQLQYHPNRQYHHMRRSSHQHTAMPVRAQPLIYRHPMQPSQPSYFGLPNGGGRTHGA